MSDASINKKINELKSKYSFGDPVYSKNRTIELFCIFVSSWKYKLTEGLYFKIKYFIQRVFRGYDDLDKWNAAWFIARKSIPVLKDWRNSVIHGTAIRRHIENRHGEVIELSEDEIYNGDDIPESLTEEQWKSVIDDIIFAFEFVLNDDTFCGEYNSEDYKISYKRHKRGLKLLSIYFFSLWD